MSTAVAAPNPAQKTFAKRVLASPIMGPLAALLLACIFFAIMSDRFLSGPNFSLIMQQVMVVGVLAIGQTLIILTAGIDLSNGAVMALSGVIMASLASTGAVPPVVAIAVGFALAAGFGFVNGGLLTAISLPPFIVTLGTYSIAYALTRIYTTSTISGLPDELTVLGNTFSIGNTAITYGTLVMLLLYVLTWFVLKFTAAGRSVFAVGDNPEAARLAGIKTNRVLIGVYTVAGLTYGLAALLLVSRTGVGDPNAGATANMDSITAVVVGGTSMFGGRGSIVGTFIGALIVGVFRNGLQLMGVESIYQVLITGILVIAAVSIDQLTHRNKK